MATPIIEILAGVLRYFPNTMIITTLFGGLLLARLNWIMVGVGALVLSVLVLTVQYIFMRSLNLGAIPGAAVLEACSLLPVTAGVEFSSLPSIWLALTTYFATYILTNAINIYTTPAKRAPASIPVQQRKGLGLISAMATALLFVLLVVPRAFTGCETWIGGGLGIAVGAVAGWAWWNLLYLCFQPAWPDIHGVMLGTTPGSLRVGPLACAAVSQ